MTKVNPLDKTMKLFNNDVNLQRLFTFNEFSQDIEYLRQPDWDGESAIGRYIDDRDITQIRFYLTTNHGFEPNKPIVSEACYLLARRISYHPVKRFIEAEKWDGIPRADEWLINSVDCDDNYYTRMASSKILIAAVNRVYNPGCKFDHMLILEGNQGIGKSTLVEIMAGDWYLDTNFGHKDKDLVDSMRGALIIEISELSGMNKKDIDWLKSFLSKKVDRVRLPYDARNKDFKRNCVFIGTYNPSGNNMYLKDDTGNRRFWPIECKKMVDVKYLRENRGQIWAEAYQRYKNGEKYYIDNPAALEILNGLHNERELESPTNVRIRNWLGVRQAVKMEDIIQDCLKINMDGKQPRDLLSVSTTVGIVMRKLKWTKGTGNYSDWYYAPKDGDLL